MRITLLDSSFEITDDTAWTDQWVGLSSGDIFVGEQRFGTYVAAWYPNTNKDMQLLISAVDAEGEAKLAIAFVCSPGNVESLRAVDAKDIPWEADGIVFGPTAKLNEIGDFSRSREINELAPAVIALDRTLQKYISRDNRKETRS